MRQLHADGAVLVGAGASGPELPVQSAGDGELGSRSLVALAVEILRMKVDVRQGLEFEFRWSDACLERRLLTDEYAAQWMQVAIEPRIERLVFRNDAIFAGWERIEGEAAIGVCDRSAANARKNT